MGSQLITGSIAHRIIYPTREVTNGRDFKPSQVASQSRVEIRGNDLRNFYTVKNIIRSHLCFILQLHATLQWNKHPIFIYETSFFWITLTLIYPPPLCTLKGFVGMYLSEFYIAWLCRLTALYHYHIDIEEWEIMCHESPRPTAGIYRVDFVLFQQLGRQTLYAPNLLIRF